MESIDRAVTRDASEGFNKAVHRSNGTMLGARVVGRQAAEAWQGWSIAAVRGLKMILVALLGTGVDQIVHGQRAEPVLDALEGFGAGFGVYLAAARGLGEDHVLDAAIALELQGDH